MAPVILRCGATSWAAGRARVGMLGALLVLGCASGCHSPFSLASLCRPARAPPYLRSCLFGVFVAAHRPSNHRPSLPPPSCDIARIPFTQPQPHLQKYTRYETRCPEDGASSPPAHMCISATLASLARILDPSRSLRPKRPRRPYLPLAHSLI